MRRQQGWGGLLTGMAAVPWQRGGLGASAVRLTGMACAQRRATAGPSSIHNRPKPRP